MTEKYKEYKRVKDEFWSTLTKEEKELYDEIERKLISWSINGYQTSGSITREIIKLMKDGIFISSNS